MARLPLHLTGVTGAYDHSSRRALKPQNNQRSDRARYSQLPFDFPKAVPTCKISLLVAYVLPLIVIVALHFLNRLGQYLLFFLLYMFHLIVSL